MIGAHVGDKESAIDEAKTNRVAQPGSQNARMFAVGVHFRKACAYFFFFFAGIATAAHRNIEIPGVSVTESNGASEMPAAIFVAQSIIRVSGRYLWLGERKALA